MRKWLLGVVATIIVLLLILPFLFGLHAQNLLQQLDEIRIPLKNGEFGTVEFKVTDIHSGWLTSTATVNLNYVEAALPPVNPNAAPQEVAAPITKTLLTAKAHITHGPILWRPGNKMGLPFWGQALLFAPIDYVTENFPERFVEITGLETGKFLGYISLLGTQVIYVNTNEISFQDVAGQFNFSGFDLSLERSLSGDDLLFDLIIPHFNFMLYPTADNKTGARWLMDGIEIDFAGQANHPSEFLYGTWLGEAGIRVDVLQMEVDDKQYAVNRLDSLIVQTPGKESGLLDGIAEITLENLAANQQVVGPVDVALAYNNIDRASLEDMRKLYFAWGAAHTDKAFMDYLTPKQQQEFSQDLFNFVNHLPHFQINKLNVVTKDGTLHGDFDVKVTTSAKTVDEVKTIDFWQENIDAKLDIDAAKLLVENAMNWGLAQFYNWMNPMLGAAPQPAPETTVPVNPTEPTVPAPQQQAPETKTTADYHAEAQSLLKQAQMFGIIKGVDNNYKLSATYQEGLLSINDKPLVNLSNKSKLNK